MGQNIKIKIAGNEYPLVASSPEMERMMRLAADAINQKLAGLLLTKMGQAFHDAFAGEKVDMVLTIEASGIAAAITTQPPRAHRAGI